MPLFWVHTTSKVPLSNGSSSALPTWWLTRSVRPRRVGEHLAGAYERRGQIDHGDVAAELHGQRAGRAADAAADVQDARAGLGVEQARQAVGGRLAAAVKLVRDRQLGDGQRIDVLARGGQRRQHPLGQILPLPVVGHQRSPGCIVAGGGSLRRLLSFRAMDTLDLGLKGKIAIVTGGSEGLGRAAVERLARSGARVTMCARRKDVLERAAEDIRKATGAELLPLSADVSRAVGVRSGGGGHRPAVRRGRHPAQQRRHLGRRALREGRRRRLAGGLRPQGHGRGADVAASSSRT